VHYGEDVRQWSNATYPGYWSPNARFLAPDPTPMDFFLWGHLKEYVYAVPTRIVEDLTVRLQEAVTMVDANMSRRV
jgi:hypothetical protein